MTSEQKLVERSKGWWQYAFRLMRTYPQLSLDGALDTPVWRAVLMLRPSDAHAPAGSLQAEILASWGAGHG